MDLRSGSFPSQSGAAGLSRSWFIFAGRFQGFLAGGRLAVPQLPAIETSPAKIPPVFFPFGCRQLGTSEPNLVYLVCRVPLFFFLFLIFLPPSHVPSVLSPVTCLRFGDSAVARSRELSGPREHLADHLAIHLTFVFLISICGVVVFCTPLNACLLAPTRCRRVSTADTIPLSRVLSTVPGSVTASQRMSDEPPCR